MKPPGIPILWRAFLFKFHIALEQNYPWLFGEGVPIELSPFQSAIRRGAGN
jgi:hypothetical protein